MNLNSTGKSKVNQPNLSQMFHPCPLWIKLAKKVKNKKTTSNTDTIKDIDGLDDLEDLPEDLANMLLDDNVF